VRKVGVLRDHCEAVGRDPLEIEHTLVSLGVLRDDREEAARVLAGSLANNGSPHVVDPERDFLGSEEQVAEQWRRYLDLGFTHLIVDIPSPFDHETIERLPRLREILASG
jgi:alkanesulfonate monooxygenase SsuD/methylene tetrahydromethanopterin reductase-like flavin-dependent oxidoreductase (luciferase family)